LQPLASKWARQDPPIQASRLTTNKWKRDDPPRRDNNKRRDRPPRASESSANAEFDRLQADFAGPSNSQQRPTPSRWARPQSLSNQEQLPRREQNSKRAETPRARQDGSSTRHKSAAAAAAVDLLGSAEKSNETAPSGTRTDKPDAVEVQATEENEQPKKVEKSSVPLEETGPIVDEEGLDANGRRRNFDARRSHSRATDRLSAANDSDAQSRKRWVKNDPSTHAQPQKQPKRTQTPLRFKSRDQKGSEQGKVRPNDKNKKKAPALVEKHVTPDIYIPSVISVGALAQSLNVKLGAQPSSP
jgi:hypothetical protein